MILQHYRHPRILLSKASILSQTQGILRLTLCVSVQLIMSLVLHTDEWQSGLVYEDIQGLFRD